jgi:hypothetical protein
LLPAEDWNNEDSDVVDPAADEEPDAVGECKLVPPKNLVEPSGTAPARGLVLRGLIVLGVRFTIGVLKTEEVVESAGYNT